MRPLTENDIKSELSYAYLHAVVSRAGAACRNATRAEDGNGIDAQITGWGPFPNGGYREEVDIKVQLKATSLRPVLRDGFLNFELQGIRRYNDLRSETVSVPRILIVLFLPEDSGEWVSITEESLMMKRCAHWVSLRGAVESQNTASQTVYLPQTQIFHGEGLISIFGMLSRGEALNYIVP